MCLVEEIINSVDPNQDGKLQFEEFIALMGQLEKKIQTSEGARKGISGAMMDKDGSMI